MKKSKMPTHTRQPTTPEQGTEVKAKVDKRLSGKDGNERIVSNNIIIAISIIAISTKIIIIFVESRQVSGGSWSGQHPGLGPDSCLMVGTDNAAVAL